MTKRRMIVTGRGGGKTTQMLQWMREAPQGEHRIIVCPSGQEAMRLLRENPDLESWQFVSLEEVMDRDRAAWSGVLHGRGGRVVLGLDNLDMMLDRLIYWPVEAFSVTEFESVSASPSAYSEPKEGADDAP